MAHRDECDYGLACPKFEDKRTRIADNDPLVARMRVQTSALVQAHARMGTRPRWDVGPIQVNRIMGPNGKHIVKGKTAGRRYTVGGRTVPVRLEPPPQEIISARLEWFVWRAALERIVHLSETWIETTFAPQQPDIPWRPWLDGEPKPRVHTITPGVKMQKLPLKPQRPITQAEVEWPLAGPLRVTQG